MTDRRVLIVMAKAPRLGFGKSRLARDIGRAEALRLQRAMLAHTLRQARSQAWQTLVCVTPDSAAKTPSPLWDVQTKRVSQGGGDLGARLTRVMQNRRRVMVIGTDCPGVRRAHIAAAFAQLRGAPIVIGPAVDGGFWCLAARRGKDVTGAFRAVRWSSAHARADVEGALKKRVVHAATLIDVDDARSWRAFNDLKRGNRALRHWLG
jgi:rSAM/selenodomain-associated transferase 1